MADILDCHVHCRDDEWRHKETIEHALRVAEDVGLAGIFDMPNTKPAVTTRKRVLERLELARNANSNVFFGVYIGLTSDKEQIRESVETWREFFPQPEDRTGVVGLKMFAGKSVGDLSVTEPEAQQEVYRQLFNLSYNGVLVVHCEKESFMKDLWNPKNPISHCEARPEQAETESIEDQIGFAYNSRFRGHLHIAHVSTPRSVVLVRSAPLALRASCGVTPNHLLLNNGVMLRKDGIAWKVNPPLRNPETQRQLLAYARERKIDVLESDHAPHAYAEKFNGINGEYMSGIPGLASWQHYLLFLEVAGVPPELIERMTFENVNQIFGLQIQKRSLEPRSINHMPEYAFDPCLPLKEK